MYSASILGKQREFSTKEQLADWVIEQCKERTLDELLFYKAPPHKRITNDYNALRRLNTNNLFKNDTVLKSSKGQLLADYFTASERHKAEVRNQGNWFQRVFKNEQFLRRVINKVFVLSDTKHITVGSIISMSMLVTPLRGMTKENTRNQALSNFNAAIAKTIYEHYCPKQNATILDQCAGYGGRLVGCMSSKYNYNYTGIDPNSQLRPLLEKIISTIQASDRASIICSPFEDVVLKQESFDLSFTSPPYFNKEEYSKEQTQSYLRYPTYPEWIKCFYQRLFLNTFGALKRSAYCIINTADVFSDGQRWPLLQDTIKCAESSGFEHVETKYILLSAMPGIGRPKTKKEPLIVFKKEVERS